MKLTIIANGKHSIEWPHLEVLINNRSLGTKEVQGLCELDFDLAFDHQENIIKLKYTNKQEHHTQLKNGEIIQDQELEILKIRLDDMLLDSWVLTEGWFYPNYFAGFKKLAPDAPKKLKSQLIWHFPGEFVLPNLVGDNFWFWYRDQRRHKHSKKHFDKDGHRDERYIGSLDPLSDLVAEIKDILNV